MQAGDTVVLKSGSPVMTVNQVATMNGIMSAWCVWFDGKKEARATFPITSLKPIDMDADD
jgi:uncharacterized protein YodC (DUF2158 family)